MTSHAVTAASPSPLPERLRTALRPRPVSWPTVLAVAALMAYANGFVLTSIRGAVGAIERTQSPFATWLWTSTLLVPVYLVAVLGALALAHRRLGRALGTARRILAAAALIVAAGALVGFGDVVASGVYDYHLQSQQLVQTVHLHGEHEAASTGCSGLCAELAQTRQVDERAARYATATILAVDAVLIGWVLALRGGRLDSTRLGRARSAPGEPAAR